MRLTTRSMTSSPTSTKALDLDPARRRAHLQPVERATMLPPAAFADQGVLDWELDQIFRGWVVRRPRLAPSTSRASSSSASSAPTASSSSAARTGRPRAFLNVCRHRGARIVEETEGKVRKRLRCPYHAWSYDLDGSLRAAPHMDGVEDFDFSCNGLLGVRLAVVGGLVLIDLSGERARTSTSTSASFSTTSSATGSPSCDRAGDDHLRGRRRTGRGSPRTTTSACTAPASTPSSTRSATT